jgi:hypothetical protein
MKQVQIFAGAEGTQVGIGLAATNLTTSLTPNLGGANSQALVTAAVNLLGTGPAASSFIIQQSASWLNTDPTRIKIGLQAVEHSGHWSQSHEPAVTVRATTTKAAVAGTRHICTGFSGSLIAVAAIGVSYLRVRNSTTGAGTILWSMAFTCPAGVTATCINYALSGLSLAGTSGNAMTVEWDGAPGATNFQAVSMCGYSLDVN